MWEELYEKYRPELVRYCTGICRDGPAAEDLVQETFLKALQNADLLEDLGPNQRRAWLYRTVKNLYVDRYRRNTLEEDYLRIFRDDAVQEEVGFDTTEVYLLLQRLPQPDRTLFQLRYLEGYNAAELAEMFDLPSGTIRSKLSRSRVMLKEMILEK